ncbi:MAG: type II secretion system F family protein [Gemmatimonadaceae bacterium]
MGSSIQTAFAGAFPFVGAHDSDGPVDIGEHTYISPAKLVELLEPAASMVASSRISPDEAFHSVAQSLENPVEREVCLAIAQDIREGFTLPGAMARFPRTFSSEIIAMVSVGAEAGMMAEALNEIAAHLTEDTKLWESVAKAARYPIFVIIAFALTLLATITAVIPKEEATFADLMEKAPELMPMGTRVLLWMSQTYRAHWIIISAVFGVGMFSLIRYMKSYEGKQMLNKLLLTLPVTKSVTLSVIRARFLRHAGRLIRSKKSSAEAFSLAARSVPIQELAERYEEIGPRIQEGAGVTEALRDSDLFPGRVTTYAQAGERSGFLPDLLEKAALHETREANKALEKLLAALPNYMLLLVSVFVVALVYAQYAGIFAVNRYYQTLAMHP